MQSVSHALKSEKLAFQEQNNTQYFSVKLLLCFKVLWIPKTLLL